MNPKISVIIPCFNSEKYLNLTLRSVYNQTFSHWECLIVNDGSVDNSEEIALSWCNLDSRFLYFRKKNGGPSEARNFGLDRASGDFIQFLDSDDYIVKEKFEKSLQALGFTNGKFEKKNVVSNFRMFSEEIENSSDPYCSLNDECFSFQEILNTWPIKSVPIHCGFFYKSFFEDFRFPKDVEAYEDWLMWLHMFKREKTAVFIDQPLAFYRRHADSITTNQPFVDENLKRAVKYVKHMIHIEDYIYFNVTNMQRMYVENRLLKQQIEAFEKSSTVVYARKINRGFVGLFLRKLLKALPPRKI